MKADRISDRRVWVYLNEHRYVNQQKINITVVPHDSTWVAGHTAQWVPVGVVEPSCVNPQPWSLHNRQSYEKFYCNSDANQSQL